MVREFGSQETATPARRSCNSTGRRAASALTHRRLITHASVSDKYSHCTQLERLVFASSVKLSHLVVALASKAASTVSTGGFSPSAETSSVPELALSLAE